MALLFLPLAGLLTYLRWNYRWILTFTTLRSVVFIVANIVKPEIHNKVLTGAIWAKEAAKDTHLYFITPFSPETHGITAPLPDNGSGSFPLLPLKKTRDK